MVNITNGNIINGVDCLINGFSIDSRTIREEFFIPIVGIKFNGHDYIIDAVKKGSIGFFVNKECKGLVDIINECIYINNDVIIIEVADTLETFHKIAKANRDKFKNTKVIAITGSVGKSSVKELLYDVLSKKYNVLKSIGNFNNHIGLPKTLLNIDNHDICIIELGMNHLGEISTLSKMASPNIGIITNIGSAHIGNLGNKENILKAKLEIIDGFNDESLLVINKDDEYLKDIKYKNIEYYSTYEIEKKNRVGRHNLSNLACVYKIGSIFSVSKEEIENSIINHKGIKGRLKCLKMDSNVIINDSYNNSYESLINGIDYINNLNYRKKIIILGDVLELGIHSKTYHEKIADYLNNYLYDYIITYGTEVMYTYDKLVTNNKKHFMRDEINLLNEFIKNKLDKDTLIYIKGSNKMNMIDVVNYLTKKNTI